MAVARIKLEAEQHRRLARVAEDIGEQRMSKELGRAATRPGLVAELTSRELYALTEGIKGRIDVDMTVWREVAEANTAAQECEERERQRPRGTPRNRR